MAWLGLDAASVCAAGGMSSTAAMGITDISSDFLLLLVETCPKLSHLDICGMRCFHASLIQRVIDARLELIDQNMVTFGTAVDKYYVPLRFINMKFLSNPSGSTAQLDQMVAGYPAITIII